PEQSDREGPFGPKFRWLCADAIEVAPTSSSNATMILVAVIVRSPRKALNNRPSRQEVPLSAPAQCSRCHCHCCACGYCWYGGLCGYCRYCDHGPPSGVPGQVDATVPV